MDRTARRIVLVLASALLGILGGCASDDVTDRSSADARETRAADTIAQFKRDDPSIGTFFESAAGYAVFPQVGKGGLFVGGGYGEGVVYDKSAKVLGYTTMTFGTVGAQIGGQAYSEIIFFKEPPDLEIFKRGNFEFDAQVTAVAAKSGAAKFAGYSRGVAVFVTGERGLMAEATVGGQKFRYFPK